MRSNGLKIYSIVTLKIVNHLHYHCFTYPAELVLDNIPLESFRGDVKLISPDYPVKALCVEVEPVKSDILKKSKLIEKLIDVFYQLDIAHNVNICRSTVNTRYVFVYFERKMDFPWKKFFPLQ